MKRIMLILIVLLSINSYAQKITLYESGNGTPNSILDDFNESITIFSNSLPLPLPGQHSFTSNGQAGEYLIEYPGHSNGIFFLSKAIGEMSNYTNLEFYIDYTIIDTTSELTLLSSNDFNLTTIINASGNLIASNVTPLSIIPYINNANDSILKIQFEMTDVDSVLLQVNYIRISADSSSIVGINELEAISENISIESNDQSLNIINQNSIPYHVEIYSLSGQQVFAKDITQTTKIPMNNYVGLFIVSISDSKNRYTQKIYMNN